jgi:hypothetical protein
MKKQVFLAFALVFVSMLFSEIQTVKNHLLPNVPKKKLKLETSYDFGEEMDAIGNFIITNDKIFALNPQEKSLKIYDLKGKLLKNIDQSGKGPGELLMPTNLFEDKKNSSIGVVDQMNRRTSYFDYEGNYIKDVPFKDMKVPMDVRYLGNKKLYFYMGIEFDKEKGSIVSKPTVELIDGDSVKVLYSASFNPMKMNIGTSKIPIYAISNENIFITSNSINKYQIQVFDDKGNKLKNISKKFKKGKKSKKDLERIKSILDRVKKQVAASGSKMDLDYSGYQYKNAIDFLMIGPNQNLWVKSFDKKGNLFDIIGKDAKIMSQYRLSSDFGYSRIYKGKLYEISGDEDNGFVLNVYDLSN